HARRAALRDQAALQIHAERVARRDEQPGPRAAAVTLADEDRNRFAARAPERGVWQREATRGAARRGLDRCLALRRLRDLLATSEGQNKNRQQREARAHELRLGEWLVVGVAGVDVGPGRRDVLLRAAHVVDPGARRLAAVLHGGGVI